MSQQPACAWVQALHLSLCVAERPEVCWMPMASTLCAARLERAPKGTTISAMLSSTWLDLLETAPGLRPADVLTTAISPGMTSALDVGVAAPHARHASADCMESMLLKKRSAYSRHLAALEAEGAEYNPLVWSCWGREHPDTTATLTQLARQAARRRGFPDHSGLLSRTRAQIGVVPSQTDCSHAASIQ